MAALTLVQGHKYFLIFQRSTYYSASGLVNHKCSGVIGSS